jgi:transcriptional regulator with XRE-family HTH domain
MERSTVCRVLRALRRRKGWTQRQLGVRLGISRSEMSRWEAGALASCSTQDAERWASALGAHLTIDLRVDGERPQLDARHATIQNGFAGALRAAGWVAEPEASFNVYGDRGRIDILGYHAASRSLLVVEVKTELRDVQDVIGRLDVKRRVAQVLARERGWRVSAAVPALVVRESTTARRRISAHAELFAALDLRTRAAMAWIRRPDGEPPAGILVLVSSRG